MTTDFEKMKQRALEIKSKYNLIEPKKWGLDQTLMGLAKDVGDLSEILMEFGGYRGSKSDDTNAKLGHELSDVLYSLFVIADKTGVDMEKSFWKTMDELDDKLSAK